MLLTGTLIVLALWLGFIWFADPDGFRTRAYHLQHSRRSQAPGRR